MFFSVNLWINFFLQVKFKIIRVLKRYEMGSLSHFYGDKGSNRLKMLCCEIVSNFLLGRSLVALPHFNVAREWKRLNTSELHNDMQQRTMTSIFLQVTSSTMAQNNVKYCVTSYAKTKTEQYQIFWQKIENNVEYSVASDMLHNGTKQCQICCHKCHVTQLAWNNAGTLSQVPSYTIGAKQCKVCCYTISVKQCQICYHNC